MLSREAFDRYIRQVSSLADSAGEYVRRMVGAYLGQHPDASVAECREFARQTMSDAVSIYGDASATAAADYYDSVMSAAGNGAKPALLHADVDDEQIERVARYQVGKLVNKGDQLGFARECASYASDATRQAANRTMIKNAQRDGRRGVRYARVPTGAETCTFCRMLSSRGFVYRSEESANLFGHNHRGCNCAVVPSTDADGLEGYDPDREYDIWQMYEKIDADTSLSRAENEAAKRAVLDGANGPLGGFRVISAAHSEYDDLAAVNPNYSKGVEWQINCQRCVAAYELRRRGFDVTALPAPMVGGKPDYYDELPDRLSKNGWPKMFDGSTLESCRASTGARTMGKVEKLMASWGDGSRAIVRVQFQKWFGGGGHVFIAEQRGGKTYFVDPQCNDRDCSGYFACAKKLETYCMRVDNLQVTDLIKKAVTNK